MNPGFDLLMAVNWEDRLAAAGTLSQPQTVPLIGLAPLAAPSNAPAIAAAIPAALRPAVPAPHDRLWRGLAYAGAGLIVLAAAGSFLVLRGKRNRAQ